jgi:hypothetical protein
VSDPFPRAVPGDVLDVHVDDTAETVEFLGRRFRVADRVGLMPIMRFAKAAKAGTDSNDMDGISAMFDLLRQCIADEDWPAFEAHADATRADGEELMGVVVAAMSLVQARPTKPRSTSSGGPRTTNANSSDGSSSPEQVDPPTPGPAAAGGAQAVVERLQDRGRPDLALIVDQAQRWSASA